MSDELAPVESTSETSMVDDPHDDAHLPAPREHLLSFYDRLREKVLATAEKKSGKLGADAVKVLLLVPDIFLLLVRLVLDKDVPRPARAMIGSVLAYFLLPIDLLPEALIGGAGLLDDLVLATAVLTHVFGGELEPYAKKHWSGPDDLRSVLRDVSEAAHRFVGPDFHKKIDKFLERHGGKPRT